MSLVSSEIRQVPPLALVQNQELKGNLNHTGFLGNPLMRFGIVVRAALSTGSDCDCAAQRPANRGVLGSLLVG